MKDVIIKPFGNLADGTEIFSYTMETDSGISATLITFGGVLQRLKVPDRSGKIDDIVCGFDSLMPYAECGGCYGATVGRCANRIGNARFTIDDTEYVLPANDGKHQLHGGAEGFWHRVWSAEAENGSDKSSVILTLESADGDMGYPGNLTARVTYTLCDNGKLCVHYTATTDKATVVNFTNHSYFDLCGVGSGRAMEQQLTLNADRITNSNKKLIPDGTFTEVSGTPYDFNNEKAVGRDINEDCLLLRFLGGYDSNYFITSADGSLRKAASLCDTVSGRRMNVYTTHPCVQLYTANMVNESEPPFYGKTAQKAHCGVCLETQAMPDAVNHPGFTDTVLRPGELYDNTTVFEFVYDKN